jgi:hypothetical protein
MNRFLSLALIFLLATQAFAFTAQEEAALTLSDLMVRKKSTYKCDIFGRQVRAGLQQKGIGITDGQETKVLSLMKQAASFYS